MNIESLLRTLPEGCNERIVFQSLYEIIHALDMQHTERAGMVAICALEVADITFDDGRVIGPYPFEFGIEDLCKIVAVELYDVQPKAIIWKSRYPGFLMDRTVYPEGLRLKALIAELPFIKSIE